MLVEYLFLLRDLSKSLKPCGSRAMSILAAAVSDFYIPEAEMSTHKIQSGGDLHLHLRASPKMLGEIKGAWAPECLCVSFKLETDHEILRSKAEGAIAKYGVDIVVANELYSRYEHVNLYFSPSSNGLQDMQSPLLVSLPRDAKSDLEVSIVDSLIRAHATYCESSRDVSRVELGAATGEEEGARLWVSCCGRVYDVSQGRSFYGPGGAYHIFAGHDASLNLARMSLKDGDLDSDYSSLSASEQDTLNEWCDKFDSRYPVVGRLV
jgi:predicted heme/steroid binding protein